ncbi:MAG TPA: hypothetical protein QF753_02385 [Victivallales bacterium]|nr:hypothetical protein [Victivallales bacterium]
MKKFLKQNPILSTVIITTAIIGCYLLFLIVQINLGRTESNENLTLLKDKINRLNRHRPYPSARNIIKINSDISTLSEQIEKIKEIYGAVYSKALNAFIHHLFNTKIKNLIIEESKATESKTKQDLSLKINKLKKLTKTEQLINFKKAWTEYIEKQKNAEYDIPLNQLLEKFRLNQNYSLNNFNSAKIEFKEQLQQETIENINPNNIDEYLLNALGIPLIFTRVRCKTFVMEIEKTLNSMFKKANVNIPSGNIKLFNEFRTVPNDDQIPYIIQYSRFFEDFFSRLISSNVDSILAYRKLNGLKGTDIDQFTILKYELVIIAEQKSLRNFLNNLQEAYKSNRIYKIKSLALIKVDDEVETIKPYHSDNNKLNNKVKILLGTSELIKSTIQVEYIIYNEKPVI